MAETIKWGIIGLGKIARTFAQDIQQTTGAALSAVASRSADKAQVFATEFNVKEHYSTYQAFIENAEVDVVYIATPHPFHVALSKACIKSGKAVLCEKPIGMNAFEVQRLITFAQTKNLFLMEGIWTRFMPSFQKMQALLAEGVLGAIRHIEADFGFTAKYDVQNRLFNKQLGGGALLDIGIYPLFLSLSLLGWPSNIKAFANFSETGIDNDCTINLEFESQATAKLFCSFTETTLTEAIIYGENGVLKLHSRFHHSQKISLHLNDGKDHHFELPYLGNGYVHEIEEVSQCVRAKLTESPLLPLSFSLELTRLLDAVREEINLQY